MSNLIVLIVEDNLIAQYVLKQILAKFDYDSHAVCSGEDAIEAVNTTQYACVLMDINLPGIDGYTTAHQIKALDHVRDTPIIAITGHPGSNYQTKAEKSGIVDLLLKPFNAEDLRHILLRRVYDSSNINLKVLKPSSSNLIENA
jgi:CheY-like chemotaxis protein